MFFLKAAKFILRNRLPLLLVTIALTVFFGWQASKVQLSYEFAKILPKDDSTYIAYEDFKKQFGEDGTVMVIGLQDSNFFTLEKYNDWYDLSEKIKRIDGIEALVSVSKLFNIVRNDSTHQFDLMPLMHNKLQTQEQVDSIKNVLDNLPFYKNFIFNNETHAHAMAITFDKKKLNTRSRIDIVAEIKIESEAYAAKHHVQLHYSGMPYIRTAISQKVSKEMGLFLLLAVLVCAVILLVFFRNLIIVFFALLVVGVGVVWSVATIHLLGYQINILTGLIPPLIIVIGIPNCILLLNKYHAEYVRHNNQGLALIRMIQRIGFTTFLANVTTSIGFAVFYFTGSKLLMEFGLVAALNIMATYLISLILIPIVFSYLKPPPAKHVKHLDAPRLNKILLSIDNIVHRHTRIIFGVVIIITVVSIIGMARIKALGYVVDDLPKNDPIYTDLKFFETNFKGVLPLEISIDTKKPNGVFAISNLHKINKLTRLLNTYPEFSKPLSIADGIKFSYQAYNYGNASAYVIPTSSLDLGNISSYLGQAKNKQDMFKAFIDSSKQKTRVSVQMADIGSVKMKSLIKDLTPRIDSIFPKENYNIVVTGNSLNFLKGNDYLLKNLLESILLAIVLITIIMSTLFMSARMILLSILPSIIPLLMTAGIMGFAQIPLKPSTILIFSIAFGIASDQTIYFLTKYRHEIKKGNVSISKAVTATIRETGVSMIYSAVILFFGFLIFAASGFGGTASLGKLISITLLEALVCNLVLLPAFLIALEKRMTTKAFLEEPLVEILDEDDDINQDELLIKEIGDV